ncbi:MAG: hypothetical protein RLZZ126_1865 [Pseudomonadota bacterium]|jgi:ribosome-associated toxin RatA of RatAB toxin-antitoxin module
MKTLEKNVLIWYSPQEMFDLVADVAAYPQFLPWCDHATVLEESAQGMRAELGLSMGAVHQRFTTRNVHEAGKSIHIELVEGPFSRLTGLWLFHPVGDGGQRACKIAYTMQYGFSSKALEAVVGPVFDKVAGSLVDAFVKRAEHVYGPA